MCEQEARWIPTRGTGAKLSQPWKRVARGGHGGLRLDGTECERREGGGGTHRVQCPLRSLRAAVLGQQGRSRAWRRTSGAVCELRCEADRVLSGRSHPPGICRCRYILPPTPLFPIITQLTLRYTIALVRHRHSSDDAHVVVSPLSDPSTPRLPGGLQRATPCTFQIEPFCFRKKMRLCRRRARQREHTQHHTLIAPL